MSVGHSVHFLVSLAGAIVFNVFGCQVSISPPPSGGGDGTPSGGGGSGGGSPEQIPVVSLQASNVTPQVNETVVLQCSVVSGGGTIQYAFQPTFGRLTVDASTGRATFIVADADVGAAMRFTCTAGNQAGTSAPSNEVVITPSAPP